MRGNMILEAVRRTITENDLLSKGDHVIVGLSGGPDSVCLFLIMLELKDELGLGIDAVHLNHLLRPGDAEEDQAYVEALCREAGIVCHVSVRDCIAIAAERGITTEEAGRDLRYEAYYEAARGLAAHGVAPGKIKIAVGQNKNDLAETLLMRIVRGTGVNGLSGIEYRRGGENGTTVIRPLLDIERADIEAFNRQRGVKPRMDLSNEQPVYTRNKVRLELLPYIAENLNENIVDALARLSKSAKEDNEFLRKLTEEAYGSLIKEPRGPMRLILDRRRLKETDPAIRHRIILTALREIGLAQDVSAPHLQVIDHIILGRRASAEASLPGGYALSVSYDDVIVCGKGDRDGAGGGNLSLSAKILSGPELKTVGEGEHKGLRAVLDYGRLTGARSDAFKALKLRGREPGDFFTPKGMKEGKKKMQDYFVDRKIAKGDRDKYRVVALGKEILWVFDPQNTGRNEINEKYRISGETKEALLLEIDVKL